MALWYYAQQRQKLGPIPFAELRNLAKNGMLQPTDMLLEEGTHKWVVASSIVGLFPSKSSCIEFLCPKCGTRLKLADKFLAGRLIRCPKCKQSVRVPSAKVQITSRPRNSAGASKSAATISRPSPDALKSDAFQNQNRQTQSATATQALQKGNRFPGYYCAKGTWKLESGESFLSGTPLCLFLVTILVGGISGALVGWLSHSTMSIGLTVLGGGIGLGVGIVVGFFASFFTYRILTAKTRRFFHAVIAGDVTAVQSALDQGVPVDSTTAFGVTALHLAGTREVARTLLMKGAAIESAENDQRTLSSQHDDDTEFLQAITNLTTEASGLSPLHYAVLDNRCDVVTFLLQQGASPKIATSMGYTALHFSKSSTSAKALLYHGANDDARDNERWSTFAGSDLLEAGKMGNWIARDPWDTTAADPAAWSLFF